MAEELSQGAIRNISLMRRILKGMPDLMMVEAVQELAELIERNRAALSEDDVALLIGFGAQLMTHADAEMAAGIRAAMLLRRVD